jgi:hypothetical protein
MWLLRERATLQAWKKVAAKTAVALRVGSKASDWIKAISY